MDIKAQYCAVRYQSNTIDSARNACKPVTAAGAGCKPGAALPNPQYTNIFPHYYRGIRHTQAYMHAPGAELSIYYTVLPVVDAFPLSIDKHRTGPLPSTGATE